MSTDNPHHRGCASIEGRYVPIREAKISVLEAGFSRSEVTYDVVAVWNGKFFRLQDHLDRFERSRERFHLDLEVDRQQIEQILHQWVRRSGLREASVDMIATRGWPARGGREPWTFRNQFFHWGDLTRGAFEANERGGTAAALPDLNGNPGRRRGPKRRSLPDQHRRGRHARHHDRRATTRQRLPRTDHHRAPPGLLGRPGRPPSGHPDRRPARAGRAVRLAGSTIGPANRRY